MDFGESKQMSLTQGLKLWLEQRYALRTPNDCTSASNAKNIAAGDLAFDYYSI